MRLTTDEILEQFPSMNASGKHYDTVQGRFYGDLPTGGRPLTLHCDSNDKHIQNVKFVDHWVAQQYPNEDVYKCNHCYGEGYIRVDKDGNEKFIGGRLSIKYGGKYPYEMTLFNHHGGSHGFNIWKGDTGKNSIVAYTTNGFSSLPTKAVRDTISLDTIEKLFSIVKKNDEFGKCAKMMIEAAEEIMLEEKH